LYLATCTSHGSCLVLVLTGGEDVGADSTEITLLMDCSKPSLQHAVSQPTITSSCEKRIPGLQLAMHLTHMVCHGRTQQLGTVTQAHRRKDCRDPAHLTSEPTYITMITIYRPYETVQIECNVPALAIAGLAGASAGAALVRFGYPLLIHSASKLLVSACGSCSTHGVLLLQTHPTY
jgi:hypothetical protein